MNLLRKHFPGTYREIARDGKLYLSRWVLFRSVPARVFFHKFYLSDPDESVHSHPWHWSFSIILKGGYKEERRVWNSAKNDFEIVVRDIKPGNINVIWGDTFHRVTLNDNKPAWSLFFAGKRLQSWYFYSMEKRETIEWFKFLGCANTVPPEDE